MGLEDVFGKVEKLPEEKKLEVITTKENVIRDLESYFEKNKYKHGGGWFVSLGECEEYFDSCMDFLKTFELNPEIISEFNVKASNIKGKDRESFGVYLSALIQTSYNQGCNNFVFDNVSTHCFGALLKGQPTSQIKIIVKKELKGDSSLWCAENCRLTTKTLKENKSLHHAKNSTLKTKTLKGNDSLLGAEDCSLTAETLEGNDSLWDAEGCLAEIKNYQGTNFGYVMKNCTIKSENKKTLELIKEQAYKRGNNKFELTK